MPDCKSFCSYSLCLFLLALFRKSMIMIAISANNAKRIIKCSGPSNEKIGKRINKRNIKAILHTIAEPPCSKHFRLGLLYHVIDKM